MSNTESEIEIILMVYEYLESTPHPHINNFLKSKFVDFEKMGFGTQEQFIERHNNIFKSKLDFKIKQLELDLIKIIKDSNSKPGGPAHAIQLSYGPGPFSRFGFGTYRDFLMKHNLPPASYSPKSERWSNEIKYGSTRDRSPTR